MQKYELKFHLLMNLYLISYVSFQQKIDYYILREISLKLSIYICIYTYVCMNKLTRSSERIFNPIRYTDTYVY